MGGGFELALAADLIVASEMAEFALTEVKLGMVADSGGVLRLPQRLPRAIALELLLTGRRMGAPEAARWGLVNQVVAPDALMAAASALAQQIVQAAPLAVGAVMEIVKATAGMPTPQAYQVLRGGTLPVYQAMLRSEDAAEGPLGGHAVVGGGQDGRVRVLVIGELVEGEEVLRQRLVDAGDRPAGRGAAEGVVHAGVDLVNNARIGAGVEVAARAGHAIGAHLGVPEQGLAERDDGLLIDDDAGEVGLERLCEKRFTARALLRRAKPHALEGSDQTKTNASLL
jgi:hypothetical protein